MAKIHQTTLKNSIFKNLRKKKKYTSINIYNTYFGTWSKTMCAWWSCRYTLLCRSSECVCNTGDARHYYLWLWAKNKYTHSHCVKQMAVMLEKAKEKSTQKRVTVTFCHWVRKMCPAGPFFPLNNSKLTVFSMFSHTQPINHFQQTEAPNNKASINAPHQEKVNNPRKLKKKKTK